jgi:hypothetical protein
MVQPSSPPKSQYLILIRHGERLDMRHTEESHKQEAEEMKAFLDVEIDTPLSSGGHSQAFRTGEHLSEFFKEKHIGRV